MQERWWSVRAASARFGISEDRLRIAILSGDLVAIPGDDGGDWLVREGDLVQLPRSSAFPATPARGRLGRNFIVGTRSFVVVFLLLAAIAMALLTGATLPMDVDMDLA